MPPIKTARLFASALRVALLAMIVSGTLISAHADVNDGIAARYEFDGNSDDVSGNGYALSSFGNVQFVADRFGAAGKAVKIVAPGTDGAYFVGFGPELANRSSSVAFWVRKDYIGNGSNGSWIFGLGHPPNIGGSTGEDMHVAIDYGQSLRYSFFFDDFDTATPTPNHEWFHVACTYDRPTGERRIYLNGALVATAGSARGFSGSNHLKLGSANFSLDDFRFYGRTLTAQEVHSLATVQPQPPCAEQVAALQDQVQQLTQTIDALTTANGVLTTELANALQLISSLSNSNAEASAGLDEIWRLLKLPPGKRSSTIRFTGELGNKINSIIDALLAPAGQIQSKH